MPLSTSLKLVRMGATESTHKVPVHCSSDVAVLTEKDPTYIPGTNLPVDGWLHPCVCCTTTTARIVKRPGEGLQFLCRRCDAFPNPVRCATRTDDYLGTFKYFFNCFFNTFIPGLHEKLWKMPKTGSP